MEQCRTIFHDWGMDSTPTSSPIAPISSRRQFMQYLGAGAVCAAANRITPNWLTAQPVQTQASQATPIFDDFSFQEVGKTLEDAVTLPPGYKYEVILKHGDKIHPNGLQFGDQADYLAFHLENDEAGWLWINHENSFFLKGKELLSDVGGSCIRLRKEAGSGKWRPDLTSQDNLRVNGLDTKIKLLGPAAGSKAMDGAHEVIGSVGNCGGAVSPWGTFFSGEENFFHFWGDFDNPKSMDAPLHGLPDDLQRNPRHYGWMVEVDPQTKEVFKHTALGRFGHENIAFGFTRDGRLVGYMGDDRNAMGFYKFISREKYDAAAGKGNRRLLSDGTLYVADTVNGRWIPLDPEQTPVLKEKGFDLAEICVRTRVAVEFVGGTPLARPEDVEIHPETGEIYVCLTAYDNGTDNVGAIMVVREKEGDHGELAFEHQVFVLGGKEAGLAWPDNIGFGPDNALMVTTDYEVVEPPANSPHEWFGNNNLLIVPTKGEHRGQVRRFMSGPWGAELCSPTLSPCRTELWVNVQHPGDGGKGHWPEGGTSQPRSAMIAIRRA